MTENWFCYCLSAKNSTYIGKTNNLTRRLRQHNQEICGGAKYTTKYKGLWKPVFWISGIPNNKTALQLEWRLKHPKKKPTCRGISGRLQSLDQCLKMDKWTNNCEPLDDFRNLLVVNYVNNIKEYIKPIVLSNPHIVFQVQNL